MRQLTLAAATVGAFIYVCEQMSASARQAASLHLGAVRALQSGDAPGALRLVEQAVALQRYTGEYRATLGRVYKALGRTQDAVAAYREAIRLGPQRAEWFVSLGIALRALHRGDEALAAYRRACLLAPGLPEAHHNLGNLLLHSGD